MSKFLQTCGYRYGFLCRFRYDNPKAVRHNSNFQDDGIEASPKKCIQVVNLNSVNCYEQNCLSYFYVLCYPKIPRRFSQCGALGYAYISLSEKTLCSIHQRLKAFYIFSPKQRLGILIIYPIR